MRFAAELNNMHMKINYSLVCSRSLLAKFCFLFEIKKDLTENVANEKLTLLYL